MGKIVGHKRKLIFINANQTAVQKNNLLMNKEKY